jgi:prophage regulatory protein
VFDLGERQVVRTNAPLRLIRLPEVMARVGLKRSAIYQRMSEGRFPKSRSLGLRYTVWLESEIDAWIETVLVAAQQGLVDV